MKPSYWTLDCFIFMLLICFCPGACDDRRHCDPCLHFHRECFFSVAFKDLIFLWSLLTEPLIFFSLCWLIFSYCNVLRFCEQAFPPPRWRRSWGACWKWTPRGCGPSISSSARWGGRWGIIQSMLIIINILFDGKNSENCFYICFRKSLHIFWGKIK